MTSGNAGSGPVFFDPEGAIPHLFRKYISRAGGFSAVLRTSQFFEHVATSAAMAGLEMWNSRVIAGE
jgi:hypothetical protein